MKYAMLGFKLPRFYVVILLVRYSKMNEYQRNTSNRRIAWLIVEELCEDFHRNELSGCFCSVLCSLSKESIDSYYMENKKVKLYC
ncbi:hypothetical protein T05_8446 [Trichinella murrelli]|uniref:Uncharacterized protein n=1 Tax=Trichinella murrelli TaxID=144512 RepID=A0A0V0U4K3_9BILA|nr:hypothetical protein T05_8446 [Trichinella murrelli]